MAKPAMPDYFAIFTVAVTLVIYASLTLAEEDNVLVQFSYAGATGPDKWGSLNPAFSACFNGKSQSPIDIVREKVVPNINLKPLTRRYNTLINATLVNNGFNVELRCGENSGVLISDDRTYRFKQMHWHSPSEHRINGFQYDAELHLVHIADDGSIAVVGVLYRLGHADPLLAKPIGKKVLLSQLVGLETGVTRQLIQFKGTIRKIIYPQKIQHQLHDLAKEHVGGEVAIRVLSMRQLMKNTSKYYRYSGSLTTPPCTEPVVWHILGKVRSISREQLEALKAPLSWECKNNSRPAQPLEGRLVQLYMQRETPGRIYNCNLDPYLL